VPIGTGAVAEDPFAGVVDVAAGGEVHHRVRAPADRPDHLVDFARDVRRDGGVADIGVDLDQEVAADRHRLGFGVVDVVGDDRAAAGDFVADEFGGDVIGDGGAEALAVADIFGEAGAAEILALGDIFHLGRDDAAAGVVHLADVGAGLGAQHALADIGEGLDAAERSGPSWPLSSGRTSRWVTSSTSPRARIHGARSSGRPAMMSIRASGSLYGPEVS
jgi:hypothetical protein